MNPRRLAKVAAGSAAALLTGACAEAPTPIAQAPASVVPAREAAAPVIADEPLDANRFSAASLHAFLDQRLPVGTTIPDVFDACKRLGIFVGDYDPHDRSIRGAVVADTTKLPIIIGAREILAFFFFDDSGRLTTIQCFVNITFP